MSNNRTASDRSPAVSPISRILIIDDDAGMCYTLMRMAQEAGYQAQSARTLAEGRELSNIGSFDVVFLDVRLPDGSGLDAVGHLQSLPDPPEIIIITGYGTRDGAKTALKSGVWDYIEKPARINALKLSLKRALQYRRQKQTPPQPPSIDRCGIVGRSSKLKTCLLLMSHAARSQAGVLLCGETGTGKELFARAIHQNSARAGRPFVVVDCAALPRNLAESILFGHVKGAYTGADRDRSGLIKKADGGTLFLDEVGELAPALQKTFLRVLQEKRFRAVGGHGEIASDFRLLSATNRDLESEVDEGRFRRDLFFRLQTIMIEIPPLRDRKKDIGEIVETRVKQLCTPLKTTGLSPSPSISPEFLKLLQEYHWPGNVRELLNVIDSALALEPGCPTLYPKHIPDYIRTLRIGSKSGQPLATGTSQEPPPIAPPGFPTLKGYRSTAIGRAEKYYLEQLTHHCRGDIDLACRLSGLKRARFYQLIKKHHVLKPGN